MRADSCASRAFTAAVPESKGARSGLLEGAGASVPRVMTDTDPDNPVMRAGPGRRRASILPYLFLALVAGFGGYWVYAHRDELAQAWT